MTQITIYADQLQFVDGKVVAHLRFPHHVIRSVRETVMKNLLKQPVFMNHMYKMPEDVLGEVESCVGTTLVIDPIEIGRQVTGRDEDGYPIMGDMIYQPIVRHIQKGGNFSIQVLVEGSMERGWFNKIEVIWPASAVGLPCNPEYARRIKSA